MDKFLKDSFKYLNRVDYSACCYLNHLSRITFIRLFFKAASRLGDGVFWYCLMIFIIGINGYQGIKPVLMMLIFGGMGTIIYKILKNKISRPRPYQVHQAIVNRGKILDHFSFPSGHTLHAVIFSMIAMYYYPELTFLVLPFTLLVAMSRVILGIHYPTDVIVSLLIGLFIADIAVSADNIFSLGFN